MGRVKEEEDPARAATERFIKAAGIIMLFHDLSAAEFCRRVNYTHQNFISLRKGINNRNITIALAVNFCNEFDISADWLMLGKGDMMKKEQEQKMLLDKMASLLSAINPNDQRPTSNG